MAFAMGPAIRKVRIAATARSMIRITDLFNPRTRPMMALTTTTTAKKITGAREIAVSIMVPHNLLDFV
jgi:hypothetical protein